MDPIIKQIKELAASSIPVAHKEILDSLRELSLSLETPGDTVQRLVYGALESAVARIGIDLNLFDILANAKEPLSSDALAEKTKAAPLLLSRLLRYTSSVGMTKQNSDGKFTSTNISESLTKPGIKAGINVGVDTLTPAIQALPALLSGSGYKDISDPTKTAFQLGLQTSDEPFQYLLKRPAQLGDFMQWMTAQHEGHPTWLDVYPLAKESQGFPSERSLFVDVGGGIGHQCLALKTKYPQFDEPGRLVLQDLGPTIEHSIPMENVNAMAHDFFTPQPIKGAKFYYMRNVLHDHPDHRCQIILKHIVSAMKKDSVLLIDEMALPNGSVHWQASQLDILMMLTLAAMERTVAQWHDLLGSVGLKIMKIHTYTDLLKDSIIVAVPA